MALFDLKSYLETLYPSEFERILQSLEAPKDVCFFINRLKTSAQDLEASLTKANIEFTRLDAWCYLAKHTFKASLTHLESFKQGHFYVQNYASYLAALNLNVKAGESVLDMCAAPGGKSVNLANFMQNEGELACVEASKQRFFILQENLRNYGVKARCFLKDAKSLGRAVPLKFDKILLDAPCSSYGKLGLEIKKSAKEIKQIALLQKKLLHSGLKALKIGGELVYSTCTFLKEENEAVLENAFQSEFKLELLPLNLGCLSTLNSKDLSLSSLNLNAFKSQNLGYIQVQNALDERFKQAKRILPNTFCNAFFIAKIKKLA